MYVDGDGQDHPSIPATITSFISPPNNTTRTTNGYSHGDTDAYRYDKVLDDDDSSDESIIADLPLLFSASSSSSFSFSSKVKLSKANPKQHVSWSDTEHWRTALSRAWMSYAGPKKIKQYKAALAYIFLMILIIVPVLTIYNIYSKAVYMDIFRGHEGDITEEQLHKWLAMRSVDHVVDERKDVEHIDMKNVITKVDLDLDLDELDHNDSDDVSKRLHSETQLQGDVEEFYESLPLDLSTLPDKLQEYITWHKAQLRRVAEYQAQNAQRKLEGKEPLPPLHPPVKYVMYTCDKTISKCRGLGDRIRGIVSLFYYAVMTRRVFGIHWDTPVPLQDTLMPAHVDWITANQFVARYTSQEERVPIRIINKNFLMFRSFMFDFDEHNEMFGHPDEAELQGTVLRDRNETALLVATNAAYHYIEMWDLGLREALGLSEDTKEPDHPLASWALMLLFKPTRQLEMSYAIKMRDFGLKPGDPYIASHVRLGSKSKTFFELRRHRVNDVHNFSTCALRMREYLAANPSTASPDSNPMRLILDTKMKSALSNTAANQIPVFLASDSNVAKREMMFMIPDLIYIEDDAFHVDRSTRLFRTREARRLNMLAFVELLFLIRSSCLVASKSGFSYLAVLWSASMHDQRRCWSFPFEQCLDPSSFVHNKLFINTGNKYLYG
mmetsp:Transcript_12089/g.20651  ORF Transcript_12089/g.20651 Transcript_12089/m.20651 type:complete len:667 (-) Transcript_12089:46-2046(-)